MKEANGMRSAKGFFIGVIAGGAAGALAALLYAPKSGKELRKDISVKKDKMVDDAGRYLKEKKEYASDMISDGRKKAEKIIEGAKKKIENVKGKTERIFLDGKDKIAHESMFITDAIRAGLEAYRGERNSFH